MTTDPTTRISTAAADLLAAQITQQLDGLLVADALHVLKAAQLFVINTVTFSHQLEAVQQEVATREAVARGSA